MLVPQIGTSSCSLAQDLFARELEIRAQFHAHLVYIFWHLGIGIWTASMINVLSWSLLRSQPSNRRKSRATDNNRVQPRFNENIYAKFFGSTKASGYVAERSNFEPRRLDRYDPTRFDSLQLIYLLVIFTCSH